MNPQLKIWCGNDDSKPAGLFHIKQGEYTEICGVDKGDIPERVIYNLDGTIHKSGWRRTLNILIKRRMIDKKKAERVFNYVYETKKTPRPYTPSATEKLHDLQAKYLGI